MSTDREKIKAKIQALLAKTTANGCTEEEALSAARLAGKLMNDYGMTYSDIADVRADRYGARKRPFAGGTARRHTHHESSWTHSALADFLDCKVWYHGADLIFFGSESDTEMAHYLAVVIRNAMDSECARFLKSPECYASGNLHGRTLRSSFMAGMGSRISQRLREMTAERKREAAEAAAEKDRASQTAANSAQSSALIIAEKGKVVLERYGQYCRDHKLNIKSSTSSRRVRSNGAYGSGQAAGNRVALGGTGIGGGKTANIGGR